MYERVKPACRPSPVYRGAGAGVVAAVGFSPVAVKVMGMPSDASGGITHLLLGREDDFRGLQSVLYRDLLRRVHHLRGDDHAERTEFCQVHAMPGFSASHTTFERLINAFFT